MTPSGDKKEERRESPSGYDSREDAKGANTHTNNVGLDRGIT